MKYSTHIRGTKARTKLLAGAEKVYRPVSTTLGPRGRNVVINKGYEVIVLHDGVKISREIHPEDPFEAAGARIIQEAAEKQVGSAGDGTTISIVLGYSIAKEAEKLVSSGVNPMALRKGLEKAVDIMHVKLDELSHEIDTEEEKINVATISAADPELGRMIGSTLHKIGLDGVLMADSTKQAETTLEHEEGIQFDGGYFAPYWFVTDPSDLTATLKDTHLLITDKEIDNIYEILPFLETIGKKIKSLAIISPDVKGTALASFIETKRQGRMSLVCIKAPAFGTYQKDFLQDIATMTGATFISNDNNMQFKECTFEDLGYAETVKVSKDSTTIIGSRGDTEAITARIESIKKQMDDPDSDFDREKLRERLAKLTGGVYVIKVGGATETEMNERKERVDDAILATQAAIRGGIVPGGEVTLLPLRETLSASTKTEAEEYAYRIVQRALVRPFEKLMQNAGLDAGYHMAQIEAKPFGWGVDVTDLTLKDLVKAGIIDPTIVLKDAIKNAVSVAVMLITSDDALAIKEVKDK